MLYLIVSPYNHCLWNGGKRRNLYLVSIIHACLKTALLPLSVSNKGLGQSVYTGTQQWIGIFTSLQFFEHTQVVITFSPDAWQIKSSIMYLFFERVSNVFVLLYAHKMMPYFACTSDTCVFHTECTTSVYFRRHYTQNSIQMIVILRK